MRINIEIFEYRSNIEKPKFLIQIISEKIKRVQMRKNHEMHLLIVI
jgi:hypothetical protein